MTNKKLDRRNFLTGLTAFASGAWALGCSGAKSAVFTEGTLSKVRLAQNSWVGSQLNVTIARFLLEDQMGIETELVPVSENEQWDLLSKGELHASLEVWPSRNVDAIQNYLVKGFVENGGLLGPVAKSGWYVPTYTATLFPQVVNAQNFAANPNLASTFKTQQTGNKGQLLSGSQSWNTRDEMIIRNLNLNLQVVYTSGEDELIHVIESAQKQRSHILFHLWFPHWLHGVYDFTNVELPRYTSECESKIATGEANCDYPPERLFKAFWPNLQAANARVYSFLKNFTISTTKQIELTALAKLNRQSVEGVARTWISENAPIWTTWIPPFR